MVNSQVPDNAKKNHMIYLFPFFSLQPKCLNYNHQKIFKNAPEICEVFAVRFFRNKPSARRIKNFSALWKASFTITCEHVVLWINISVQKFVQGPLKVVLYVYNVQFCKLVLRRYDLLIQAS